MATPATLNAWIDELSLSILHKSSSPRTKQSEKRLQDSFRRRVKRHSCPRTNQFEVIERLDGLEEKFQILTLDNLSDALHQRRVELKEFEHHWLPDVLDLFLHLSGDPARNDNLLALYRAPPRIGTPPPLRWEDILADDPIDRHDRLWRVPDFRDTDDSGYDDDWDDLTNASSPPSHRKQNESSPGTRQRMRNSMLYLGEKTVSQSDLESLRPLDQLSQIGETIFVREMIFLLRGYPSYVLYKANGNYALRDSFSIRGVSSVALKSLSSRIFALRKRVDLIQSWSNRRGDFLYVEAMKNAVECVLKSYQDRLNELQQELIQPNRPTTVTIANILHEIEKDSAEVVVIANLLEQVDQTEAISLLEALYSSTQDKYACADIEAYNVLLRLLIPTLQAYLEPVWTWLTCGKVEQAAGFFVKSAAGSLERNRLWRCQYSIVNEGPTRPPFFLCDAVEPILACGKTASFIYRLTGSGANSQDLLETPSHALEVFRSAALHVALPFAPAFENALIEDTNKLLEAHTKVLKSLLDSGQAIQHTFDAIEQLYLGRNMMMLDDIEPKIFDRIDRCLDGWNDRFQIRDMLEAAFEAGSAQYTIDAITIHSTFTSSRSMQSRRGSVRILSALSFEYRLIWPLANIIDEASISAYRRIFLTLIQIRRAKYSLERTGYLSVMNIPIDDNSTPNNQMFAQALAFTLLNFVNTLYDCLTTSVLQPLAREMRQQMEHALMVDEMIAVHTRYIARLQSACLVAPNLKLLRQSLTILLDLCLRFSDLVSNSKKATICDLEMEAGSFTSALSRHHTRQNADRDSEDDSSDEHDDPAAGYSSFIVLDDDTTVIKELGKLRAQYQKQVKFLIAGLRGVGKTGSHMQDLAVLADRLTWNQNS